MPPPSGIEPTHCPRLLANFIHPERIGTETICVSLQMFWAETLNLSRLRSLVKRVCLYHWLSVFSCILCGVSRICIIVRSCTRISNTTISCLALARSHRTISQCSSRRTRLGATLLKRAGNVLFKQPFLNHSLFLRSLRL